MEKITTEKKLIILTAISLSLIILLFSYKSTLYSQSFYNKEFVKNSVYNLYGREKVQNESDIVMSYLLADKTLESDFLSEQDKAHLKDVKKLIHCFDIFSYVVVGLFILCFLLLHYVYKKQSITLLSKSILYSGIFTLAAVLILFLLSLNFEWFFTCFHKIFFTNNLWLMDPAKDMLVNLFPQQFWIDAFSRILAVSLIFGIVFAVIGYFSLRFHKKL